MKSLVSDLQVRATGVSIRDGRVVVSLEDDREIRFPISKSRRLKNATDEAVRNVEIICGGTGLHWPDLDEDLSLDGIMEGRFGT